MAGDWIKMRSNLWDDPRVAGICDATGAGEAQVIGALYWLWTTADAHTIDGHMDGITCRAIDRKVQIVGFAAALVACDWIALTDSGIQIQRFSEHNGKSAKRRCLESVRKVSARDADILRTECGNDADTERNECGRDAEAVRTDCGHHADAMRQPCGRVAHLDIDRDIDRDKDLKSNTPHTPQGVVEEVVDVRSVPSISIHVMPTPEAVKAAAGWQQPANPEPAAVVTESKWLNKDGTTAGKKPATPHSVTLLPNGGILAESPAFTAFWQAYPKKAQRSEAAEAWNQAMLAGFDPDAITPAVGPSLYGTEPRFYPKPSQWLTDRRWIGVSIPAPAPKPPTPEEVAAKEAAAQAERERRQAEREAAEKAKAEYYEAERLKIIEMTAKAKKEGFLV